MTEKKAKQKLRRMLDAFTAGSILHLLSDFFRDEAEEARQEGDDLAARQCKTVEATLFVVGLGIDAARPR